MVGASDRGAEGFGFEPTENLYSSSKENRHLVVTLRQEKKMTGPPLSTAIAQDQGPVVQSVVSLTSSLRAISLTILADSIYNFLKFFAEKM